MRGVNFVMPKNIESAGFLLPALRLDGFRVKGLRSDGVRVKGLRSDGFLLPVFHTHAFQGEA